MLDLGVVEQFKAHFPTLLQEVMEELAGYEMPADIVRWVEETLAYNVPGGKMNRGVAVLVTTAIVDPQLQRLPEAIVLGWCIEIVRIRGVNISYAVISCKRASSLPMM